MEKHIAIVKSTEGKLDKYQDFAVKAKAGSAGVKDRRYEYN